MELGGIEPPTPCLQSRCSSQLSYSPEADTLPDCCSNSDVVELITEFLNLMSLVVDAFEETAVDGEVDSVDVFRCVSCEERNSVRNIFR